MSRRGILVLEICRPNPGSCLCNRHIRDRCNGSWRGHGALPFGRLVEVSQLPADCRSCFDHEGALAGHGQLHVRALSLGFAGGFGTIARRDFDHRLWHGPCTEHLEDETAPRGDQGIFQRHRADRTFHLPHVPRLPPRRTAPAEQHTRAAADHRVHVLPYKHGPSVFRHRPKRKDLASQDLGRDVFLVASLLPGGSCPGRSDPLFDPLRGLAECPVDRPRHVLGIPLVPPVLRPPRGRKEARRDRSQAGRGGKATCRGGVRASPPYH